VKTIKYVIVFCAIWIGLLIIGESKVFYLDSFSDTFQYTTMFKPHQVNDQTMKDDILTAASQNNIEFFTLKRTPTDFKSLEYQIYGTSKANDYIQNTFDIREGTYSSLLLGNVTFKFESFSDSLDIPLTTTYFMIGKEEDIHNFKVSLIDKYAGNHPREGSDGISRLPVFGVWILVTAIIILFTLYDILSQRKENLVRVTMGEKMSRIIWNNIILDAAALIFIFLVSYLTLQLFSNPDYEIQLSLLLFGLILLVNSLLYLSLLKYSLKETFSNSRTSKGTLIFNYSLKVITIIVTTAVLSSNLFVIHQSYNFYQQRDFFKQKQDFSYVNIHYELMEGEETESIEEQVELEQERNTFYNHLFYRQFYQGGTALQITRNNSDSVNEVYMNKNMEAYLKELLPSIKTMNLSKDEYYFIPERLKESSYVQDGMIGSNFYSETGDYSSEVIFYNENITIPAIHTFDDSSSYLKNPAIIFNNKQISDEDLKLAEDLIAFPYNRIMYNISDEDFHQFIKNNNLKDQLTVKTNVWDHYLAQWEVSKHLLYINAIFTILILVLEMLIISSIIRLEYQVNSLEIAIKKTLGYSLLNRYRKLIIITLSITLLGVLTSLAGGLIFKVSQWTYLLWGSVAILMLEMIFVIYFLNKADNENIPKILKGGNL
jgi:putative ABC transport system permease protein